MSIVITALRLVLSNGVKGYLNGVYLFLCNALITYCALRGHSLVGVNIDKAWLDRGKIERELSIAIDSSMCGLKYIKLAPNAVYVTDIEENRVYSHLKGKGIYCPSLSCIEILGVTLSGRFLHLGSTVGDFFVRDDGYTRGTNIPTVRGYNNEVALKKALILS